PVEAALLLSSRLALKQVMRLSTRELLKEVGVPHAVIDRMLNDNLLTLLPPQYSAVKKGIISIHENAFVSLPTSAGKTLLGELCMVQSVDSSGGVACFIAPYIAVGRQAADALRRHLPDQFTIYDLFGSYGATTDLDMEKPFIAVVATPERFDSLLRSGGTFLRRLRCVVIDEAHLVGNDQRGLRLEALITRLRLLQEQGYEFRLVCLSAVIARAQDFCQWLGVPRQMQFVDTWRPTARRVGVWLQDGTLQWFRSDDIANLARGMSRNLPLGRKAVPWPQTQVYPAQQLGAINQIRPRLYENVGYLADLLNRELSAPTLCICSTRAVTRALVDEVAKSFPPLQPTGPRLNELIREIDRQFPYLRPLAAMARQGVAYHNSALPQDVRSLIEDAVKERSLKVIAATTTLAEGVDLPFRNTIIADWLVY